MFDIFDTITAALKRRSERGSGGRTYRVDFEYGEEIVLDATKLLTSFRCEEVAFVVDGALRQSTLSKALWAIKKRRCNVLFLRDPSYRFGHPEERDKVIDKILGTRTEDKTSCNLQRPKWSASILQFRSPKIRRNEASPSDH